MNNPLDDAFSNFNKNYKDYRRTVQDVEREDEQKLKNVTPRKVKFEQLEFNFNKENQ